MGGEGEEENLEFEKQREIPHAALQTLLRAPALIYHVTLGKPVAILLLNLFITGIILSLPTWIS